MIYEKTTNIRKDYLHKVSTEIVKNHDIISVEDLAVKNIMKNHKLAQAMSDVGLGMFYSMLEYKCNWNDKSFIKIDRFFPSSKTCSKCGWINQNLTLNIRKWSCLSCGEEHDRDLNASKNILKQGLKILSVLGTNSDIKQKQVESSSLDEVVKPEITTYLM
jgi:IS605 OrfB family transposase